MNETEERILVDGCQYARVYGFKEGLAYGFFVFGSGGCVLGIWLGSVLK